MHHMESHGPLNLYCGIVLALKAFWTSDFQLGLLILLIASNISTPGSHSAVLLRIYFFELNHENLAN